MRYIVIIFMCKILSHLGQIEAYEPKPGDVYKIKFLFDCFCCLQEEDDCEVYTVAEIRSTNKDSMRIEPIGKELGVFAEYKFTYYGKKDELFIHLYDEDASNADDDLGSFKLDLDYAVRVERQYVKDIKYNLAEFGFCSKNSCPSARKNVAYVQANVLLLERTEGNEEEN